MTGRGGDVERPNPWRFVFGDLTAAKGWLDLLRAAPAQLDQAWVMITSDPLRTDHRQHQLKGSLSMGRHRGELCPQWQYEVTGAGRVWYLVDRERRTLILTHAGVGHPKVTERPRRR